MFDLPVKTSDQRRAANSFRNMLKELGYCMVQLSVYIKYLPISGGNAARTKEIRAAIPPQGKVQITFLTDTQWSKSKRIVNQNDGAVEPTPEQLTIF